MSPASPRKVMASWRETYSQGNLTVVLVCGQSVESSPTNACVNEVECKKNNCAHAFHASRTCFVWLEVAHAWPLPTDLDAARLGL